MTAFFYDDTDVHQRYDAARELPQATVALWMDTLVASVGRAGVHQIADLGCGTGRFGGALADAFSASVVGIDISQKMLVQARRRRTSARLCFVRGSAEGLPLADVSMDLVFMSMVWHHIQKQRAAARELCRVLRDGGRVAIRASTVESLDSYAWVPFFPRAREIELARAPSREGLPRLMREGDLTLLAHEIVEQRFAADAEEYAAKIAPRGLSSLQAISDQAFRVGLAGLREHLRCADPRRTLWEGIDLFVFGL